VAFARLADHVGSDSKLVVLALIPRGNFLLVRLAEIGAATEKANSVHSAELWQTKMLHNVSNVCFGEAATQRLDIWPTAGLGR
tara:strand:+ start:1493 stop:1741 length:249 start_codon:yes stop_codon:yes gene_type:complete